MKRLIAEFEPQSFTQIIFPHEKTDWKPYLKEAQQCFVAIITTITKFQKCLVVCANTKEVKKFFPNNDNIIFVSYETDDTWARDCSALSICEDEKVVLYDFTFSGWGDKFEALKDNLLTKNIQHYYTTHIKTINFVLEGGGIESNGEGVILTTAACMFNTNRNPHLLPEQRTQKLKEFFDAHEVLYLHHGYLSGDDTDSHIDTLARFISPDTIMYVQCTNTQDEHYEELAKMEQELQKIATTRNYTLIPLPMPEAIYYGNERLPATYANFLFVNGGVLVPIYGVKEDAIALDIFKKIFLKKEVIALDCSVLIRQHGSLHCVSMQFPQGVDINSI